jgi:hypothetical protein
MEGGSSTEIIFIRLNIFLARLVSTTILLRTVVQIFTYAGMIEIRRHQYVIIYVTNARRARPVAKVAQTCDGFVPNRRVSTRFLRDFYD